MAHYIVKFLVALGLAVLVYSIGIPGCSSVQFAAVKKLSCEDFSSNFAVESCTKVPDASSPFGQEEPSDDRDRSDRDQDRSTRDRDQDRSTRDRDQDRSTRDRDQDRSTRDRDQDRSTRDRDQDRSANNQRGSSQPARPRAKDLLEFVYRVPVGRIIIIIAVDNSSSMAIEHRSFASQFGSFLSNIRNVYYHIAVITTDISSSPDNPVRNAYYQDGKFIPIGRRVYLRNENLGGNPAQSVVEAFKRAIVREETTRCDMSNQPSSPGGQSQYADLYQEGGSESSVHCPSHDERGTYALNLAIRNQRHKSFFDLSGAHIIVVVLSDEDIRSSEEYRNQLAFAQADSYAFEDFDHPEVLVESLHNRFPLKSVSFYPIIIIPGDSGCLGEQNRLRSQGHGTGRGYYGKEYYRLAMAQDLALTQHGNLLKGEAISICDRNYGSQLHRIAMEANTIRVPLPCGQPRSVDLYVNERITRVPYKIEQRTLVVEPGKMSLNSSLKLRVRCESN